VITTRGWGSGAVTSAGWGATAEAQAEVPLVVAPPFFGLAGDLLHLIIRIRHETRCKVDPVLLQTQLDEFHAQLEALESCYTEHFARLRQIEGTHPLVFHVEGEVDSKVTETEFDTQRAGIDVDLDVLDSDMQDFLQRLRAMERELRVLRRNR